MYALLLYKPRNDIYPICTIPEIAVGRKAAFSDILLGKRHTADDISAQKSHFQNNSVFFFRQVVDLLDFHNLKHSISYKKLPN